MLTSSAITKEDQVKNPQAVLDVLEFYTDIQKRGGELDDYRRGPAAPPAQPAPPRQYAPNNGPTPPAARFGGTGLAGSQQQSSSSSSLDQQRSQHQQQQNGSSSGYGQQSSSSSQQQQQRQDNTYQPAPKPLQVSRPAPPPPSQQQQQQNVSPLVLRPILSWLELTSPSPPSDACIRQGAPKPAPPQQYNNTPTPAPPPPAPAQQSAIKPLQTGKKLPSTEEASTKVAERRISTMNETEIMSRLRAVVSQDDPATLYAKIKKVGQGLV